LSEFETIEFRENLNTLLATFWGYLDDIEAEGFEELDPRIRAKYINFFVKNSIR